VKNVVFPQPARSGIFDILLDPYFKGNLKAGSTSEETAQIQSATFWKLREQSPVEAMKILRPSIVQQQFTGTYQCIRRGLMALYDVDISSPDPQALTCLQDTIGNNYGQIFK
jgi:hypothetical protein